MSESRQRNGRTRNREQRHPGKLAKANQETLSAPPQTRAQLRAYARSVVQRANELIRDVGSAHAKVATLLFEELFRGDTMRALKLNSDPTPEYLEVLNHEGRTLDLVPGELSVHVRVGAVTKLLTGDDGWTNLDWTKKVALLPLVGDGTKLALLHRGMKQANRKGVGVAALREWVKRERPRKENSSGRPPGRLTLTSGRALVRTGTRLGDAEARAEFAERVRALPAPQRRALTNDLKNALENLRLLVDDLDEGDDE